MHFAKTLLPSTALVSLLGTTAAFADVSAQDVWDDWKANMEIYGDAGITIGNESIIGNTLTVTDLGMMLEDPDEGLTIEANLPSLTFTEQGDGTVLVTMADSYSFSVTDVSEFFPDEPSVIRGSINQQGLEVVVSGTPAEFTYDMTASRYGIQLDELVDFGEAIPMVASMALNNMSATYVVRPGAIREVDYSINAATTDLFVDANIPEEDVVMNFSGQIADLALTASIAVPEGLSFDDPENVDLSGILIDGGYTFGQLAYLFNFNDGYDDASGSAQADGGFLNFLFNETQVSYDTEVTGMAANIETSELPFPVSIAADTYGLTFAMPLARTDAPAPFAVGINLTNLGINDEIWMMGDPGNQLPHDPITAQIGISGTAKWLFDLLDPAQQMEMARSDMPIEPHSVQIDRLNIDALGLQVTGDGGFTFDNTTPGPIPGLPKPEGQVSVQATGINSLLDTLVAMGMVPQEEVMGVRMMMGMFATASGNDSLSSSLEINAAGHIIVNGQRIQ